MLSSLGQDQFLASVFPHFLPLCLSTFEFLPGINITRAQQQLLLTTQPYHLWVIFRSLVLGMQDLDFTHGITIQVHTAVVWSVVTWIVPVKAGIYDYLQPAHAFLHLNVMIVHQSPSTFCLPFPNAFYKLFTRWVRYIHRSEGLWKRYIWWTRFLKNRCGTANKFVIHTHT